MSNTQRAVLYARVSSSDRHTDGRNLQSQLDMCRDYAAEQGYHVVAELAEDDTGASGHAIDLPQLSKVRDLARAGDFDVLVVRELDRLSRNLAKQLIVEEELRRAGVVIEYVLAEYADTPEGRLQKHIRATVAEYERELIIERMTRGRRNKARAGHVITCKRPPYGYRQVSGALVVVDVEMVAIRLIFELYAIDETPTKICKFLEERNLLPWADLHPDRATNRRLGPGKWSKSAIRHILRNKTYTGMWEYKTNPPIVVRVPAIINPQLWETVQRRLLANKDRRPSRARIDTLLAGRVKCGTCEYKMRVRSLKGRGYGYYSCPSGQMPEYGGTCGNPMFRTDRTDPPVWAQLKDYHNNPQQLWERAKTDVDVAAHSELKNIRSVQDEHHNTLIELQSAVRGIGGGSGRTRAVLLSDIDLIETLLNDLARQELKIKARLAVGALTDKELDILIESVRVLDDTEIVAAMQVRCDLSIEGGRAVATLHTIFGQDLVYLSGNTTSTITHDLHLIDKIILY